MNIRSTAKKATLICFILLILTSVANSNEKVGVFFASLFCISFVIWFIAWIFSSDPRQQQQQQQQQVVIIRTNANEDVSTSVLQNKDLNK